MFGLGGVGILLFLPCSCCGVGGRRGSGSGVGMGGLLIGGGGV